MSRRTPVYKVCPVCKGAGRHVNPAIDGNGLDEESVSDPEFMEDYMSGRYDVSCVCCKGARVVTKAQWREYKDDLTDYRLHMAESGVFESYDMRGG